MSGLDRKLMSMHSEPSFDRSGPLAPLMSDPLAPLHSLPRTRLAHLPTPLEPMRRLGQELGLDALFVKRDDCTGLGLGGNKVRKLEFDLAAALAAGADCVVCGGVVQSNTARQVAAACAKLGIECHLGIMHGRLSATEPGYDDTGNILLDRLFGAIIHDIPWDEDRNRRLRRIADDLRKGGRNVYFVPYGASDALGAMGYALAAEEIIGACPQVAWIVHGSGSAGTQAGLLAGLLALRHPARVIGIDVDAQATRVAADVDRVGREAAGLLGVEDRWTSGAVEVAGNWSGPGYGIADASTHEAIRLAARLEGLALDPVYSGKGLAGLIGLARQGRFARDKAVVWIHTGGSPGIFAYPTTMAAVSA
jgi:L-cysteate sulfo-lyase